MDRTDPAWQGQRDYNRLLLSGYDAIVLGPVARIVWRCPAQRLLDNYQRYVRPVHLDVGPGTGFFVARAGLPTRSRVMLLDPNPTVLRHASRRLSSLDVAAVEADVLKPLPLGGPFESAALNLVLHCLPGPLERKARAIANVAAVLDPGGVLFGATVLGASGPHTRLSRAVLMAFNRRGAFDNIGDNETGIREILASAFDHVELEVVGSIAIFSATGRRT